MKNVFGDMFRVAVSGESHSPEMAVEIQGVPEGIPLAAEDFACDIDRRRAGRKGTTPRLETDIPVILRGVQNGLTTGTTLKILFSNNNTDPGAYATFAQQPRPGHADWVRLATYGRQALSSGGGMFSGRMTLLLVAAGVVAKKIIAPMQITARLVEVASRTDVLQSPEAMDALMEDLHAAGDSAGGIVECRCDGVPVGLGDPFFWPMEAAIASLVFAIPGIRGIEFGDGFRAAAMPGSLHNDPILDATGRTARNGAGGINGGLTNGNPVIFRVAVKPTSSIARAQNTVNLATGQLEELKIKGRHDVCFALRVPVIVESVAAIALCDALLKKRSQSFSQLSNQA